MVQPLQVRLVHGKKYIMVITVAFKKFIELVAICEEKVETVAKAFFEACICMHGVPPI